MSTCQKSLRSILVSKSGRLNGRVTVRHQGGGEKRYLRDVDFKRDKRDISATVTGIEYDPNRTAGLALLLYKDGERRYILAPEGLKVGEEVICSAKAEIKPGNCMPLSVIPVGVAIHNIELNKGKGGQIIRSAGSLATILSKEAGYAIVKLPSSETRKISLDCCATIGQIGNIEWKNTKFGKAGRKRHMGIRPTVRGTAQNPHSHPHGGGEGRSGEGMPPKTPWGKSARGNKTRDKKRYSNKMMIKRRN